MTEQEFLTLQEQVEANTQAIKEIKEVLAQMNEASMAVTNYDTAITALGNQINELNTALQNHVNSTSTFEWRISTLESEISRLGAESSGGVQASLSGTTLILTIPKEE